MREQVHIVAHRDDCLETGERRLAPRVKVHLKVEFSEATSHYLNQGVVTDISRTGMRIRTIGPVRLDREEGLRFWVYAGGSMIRVKGHLVRRPSTEELAIAFDAPRQPSKEKVDVEDAALRSLRFETVVPHYEMPSPREKASLAAQAREVGRKNQLTFHDSVASIKSDLDSSGQRWLARRRATHLDG